MVKKYVCHSKRVLRIGISYGWGCGARYTNLRDVRDISGRLGFLDIDWKKYNFDKHIEAAKATRPEITVARDVLRIEELPEILDQAETLLKYSDSVILVPKDSKMANSLFEIIPEKFMLGYSVPTKYGGTLLPKSSFDGRRIHLLGGRPDVQRALAEELNVVSLDCNRFTYDAKFGDYFDGTNFRPHPQGGYENCLKASFEKINELWENN